MPRTLLARSSGRALRIAGSRPLAAMVVDLAFTDGRMDGLELALHLRDSGVERPVWLVSRRAGSPPRAVRISAVRHPRIPRHPVGIPVMLRAMREELRGGGR